MNRRSKKRHVAAGLPTTINPARGLCCIVLLALSGCVFQQMEPPCPGAPTCDSGAKTDQLPAEAADLAPARIDHGTDQTTLTPSMDWVQLGNDIVGDKDWDQFGRSISLSASGERLAVGARGHDSVGFVRVLGYQASAWVQIGLALRESDPTDRVTGFGQAVSLSADGNRVAIGAPSHGGVLIDRTPPIDVGHVADEGRVIVLEMKNGDWRQLGNFIGPGDTNRSDFGRAVALSKDGTVVAIGGRSGPDHSSNPGRVQVHRYDAGSNKWKQLGRSILGLEGDEAGEHVALSADGMVVAFGSRFASDNGENSGNVRVFEYVESKQTWVQRDKTIPGEGQEDYFGTSVALSADGNTLAAGSRFNDSTESATGHVRVFQYEKGQWVQRGPDVDGQKFADYMGNSVALSADGAYLAASADGYDGDGGNREDSGAAFLFTFSAPAGKWEQVGRTLEGDFPYEYSGILSLSADGRRLAIGSAGDDSGGDNSGHIRVYEMQPQ